MFRLLPSSFFSLIALSIAANGAGADLISQAGSPVDRDQNAALQAVAKMTEGQRTYYQNNGNFRAKVDSIQQDFGVTLPDTFNYAVRTTSEAAYSYVIPARSPVSGQLKAYVGAAFITPNQDPKITTIICQSTTPGQARPADPQLVRGTDFNNPTKLSLQCGDFSVQVPASEVNE
ncbi:type IV pilin-like G/H family protein [Pannus brasiliensis CCIBt3594]|uniref:Type IV pilin-like G/H family protein n=1 Tax=Pannus brasiliensis CCIBt3594 TaxID=1427578 RepID=A0AAW9QXI7_9CHRO